MIEYEIININETPPGEWRYTCPETGKTFKHISYQPFLDTIRSHYLGNGLPIPADLPAQIQDTLVRKHPEWVAAGIARRTNQKFKIRKFSYSSTISFLQMLYYWVLDGSPMVEKAEAEQRAATCVTCPYNSKLSWGCGGCFNTVMNTITRVIGDRKTSVDKDLGNCGICSCSLQAAVWFPVDAQTANLSEDIRKDFKEISHCWKGEYLRTHDA